MIKVGIVGGTGYTGVELLRLLATHPDVELTAITSRKEDGLPVADMYPSLRGHVSLAFSSPDKANLEQCDVVFFATPHGVAMAQAPALLAAGVKVIDLAADFRLKDQAKFEQWYKIPHTAPELIAQAVYGLPELNREDIKQATLIAMLRAQEASYGDGLDPEIRHPYMWACKSHYYSSGYNFYNFPYAFGGLFARGLYAKYQQEGKDFVPLYKKMLHATSVTCVEDTAKIAGIDLTDKAFWRQGLQSLADEIDLFCQLVK